MTQIAAITREHEEMGYSPTVLDGLRPRRYMTACTFEQLLDYTREALINNFIDPEEVVCFEIFNKAERWTDYIEKESK